MAMPDYSKELGKCKCPVEGAIAPKLSIQLKKGEEISIPNDTAALGAGAIESFQLYNDTTKEFGSLNGKGSFKIADDLLRFPDKPNPLIERCAPGGSSILSTDCGNNGTGIPIFTEADNKTDMRVPVDISGNWTPQQIHGHIVFEPSGQPAGISVAITTVRSQTDCDPDGCGAPAVLPIYRVGGRGGNNINQLHIFKISDNFAKIFCCDPGSVAVREVGQLRLGVLSVTTFQSYNSPVANAGANVGILQGTSTSCLNVKNGAFAESIINYGTPHEDIVPRLKYILVCYTSNSGSPRCVKLTTYDEIGAIKITPSGSILTVNNWHIYDCNPLTAFPEPVGVSSRDCSASSVLYGSAQVGSAGDTSPACSGSATIDGVTFNNTVYPSCQYSWDNAANFLRLGNGYVFSESVGYSFNVAVGGSSISVSGTVSINKACGDTLSLTASGTFSGSKTASSCGEVIINCSSAITGPSGSGLGAEQTLMVLSIPTSTKRLYIKGNIYASATCSTYFTGVKYSQIGASCLIWIEIH